MRRLAIGLTLVMALGGLAATAAAQHDEDDNGMGHLGEEGGDQEAGVEAEGAEHHTPEINWTGSGRDEHGNPLPPPMAGMLLAFVIWAGIIYLAARKPLAMFLATRRSAILDGLEEAKRLEAAATAKHEEYTARIANLDVELAKLREDFTRAGMEERDRMVADAADRAHKMHAEAHFLVQQQLKTLREELTREAIDAAVAAADKILRERSTGADQQRLADEYLTRLRASVESGKIVAGKGGN